VTFPYLPQPKLVLDLAIQEGREHLGPVRVTVLWFRNMVTVRVIRGQMSMMVFLVGEGSGVRGHSGADVGGGQMSYIPTTQPPKPLRHLHRTPMYSVLLTTVIDDGMAAPRPLSRGSRRGTAPLTLLWAIKRHRDQSQIDGTARDQARASGYRNVRRILVRGSMPPCRLRRRKF